MTVMPSGLRSGHRAFVISIVGAESTGKTVLAAELAHALANPTGSTSARVALVSEYLREFCEVHGRTPLQHEQLGIATEQARRIEHVASTHDIVIADTTALMIAVYSEIVFGDKSLYGFAEEAQRQCDVTLLTALDVPWQADGLQRDGPHVREPVDTLVRDALNRAGVAYSVVAGTGTNRLNAALAATRAAHGQRRQSGANDAAPLIASSLVSPGHTAHDDSAAPTPARWTSACEHCGDPACERRLLGGY